MIINLQDGKFFSEGKTYSSLFGRELLVLVYDGVNRAYAEKCVNDFDLIRSELANEICAEVKKYLLDTKNRYVNQDTPEREVLKYMTPLSISVKAPENGETAWSLECEVPSGKNLRIDVCDEKIVRMEEC